MSHPQQAGTGSAAAAPRVQIDAPLDGADETAVRRELAAALGEEPPRIPSKYFYDDRGSELFERICELPEYYQTRTESALLAESADRIAELSGADELVELGAGAATKTRLLLDAMQRAGRLRLFVPMDVSEGILRRSSAELARDYPGLRVHGVVGDFMAHLEEIPAGGRRLVIFLGGTIGNLEPDRARGLLREIHRATAPGDWLLLGTDLIKDPAVIEAAYNDTAGVTAEFNLNILRVVNRQVGGDFDPAGFRHRAFYDEAHHRIEMRLTASTAQRVTLADLGMTLDLGAGDEIRTEISTKYDRRLAAELLADAGYRPVEWFTDPDDLFALSLAARG
jgi:L-histidine N-alpha-methyltransferase